MNDLFYTNEIIAVNNLNDTEEQDFLFLFKLYMIVRFILMLVIIVCFIILCNGLFTIADELQHYVYHMSNCCGYH